MKIATVSLDYHSQNSADACKRAGQRVEANKVTFAGFTEVRSSAMDRGLRDGLAPTLVYVDGGESPQCFRNKYWRLTKSWSEVLTDGKAGVTPNLSAVVGEYESRTPGKKKVAIVSTHLVPLTLHGKPRPDIEDRRRMWRQHFAALGRIVRKLKSQGLTVFVIGDFNHLTASRRAIKQISPNAKWVIRKGLDWVFVVEGSVKVRRLGVTTSFSSGSDHKSYARHVYLK